MRNGRAAKADSGWAVTKIGDLGQLYCGQSPTAATVNTVGQGTPYVSGPEQWDGNAIHQNKWTTAATRTASARSIFITVKGAGVGTLFPGIEAAIGRDIYAFAPHQSIDFGFVHRALQYSIQDVIAKARGDIPGLSKSHILDHRISLPGISTQRRVASKIDELFSRIDEGERALKRVQKLVERYRQSILKAAVTGELTRGWREQRTGKLESGEALLQRILKARREAWEKTELEKMKAKGITPTNEKWKDRYQEPPPPDSLGLPELPKGWVWASPVQLEACIPNALTIGPFGSNLKVSDYTSAGVPLIFVRNIRSRNFGETSAKFVSVRKALELATHVARGGDVLITKMGDPPGDACVYPTGSPDAVITADCIKWTLNALLSAEYMAAFINSHLGRSQFAGITKGVAQQKVSLERFRQIAIALPGPVEQRQITEQVHIEFQCLDVIELTIKSETVRSGGARQSILNSAFSGKLVPQDANDEPASVLLERIAAERNESFKPKPTASPAAPGREP